MSNLISGKEALIALANGEDVEYANSSLGCVRTNWLPVHGWQWSISDIRGQSSENNGGECRFRRKPRTILLNGVEIPAPFEPKEGEDVFCISDDHGCGYCCYTWDKNHSVKIGAWRTEDEVKKVVEALRNIFKGA